MAGDFLGGVGSGLAWGGGTTFHGLPDRGPNASADNAAIDDTVSYISRFQTPDLSLSPASPGSVLPFSLSTSLLGTMLLYSPASLAYGSSAGLGLGTGAPAINTQGRFYFSGRCDNFATGNSLDPANARFDPEGLRLSNDGKTVYVADEYGPLCACLRRRERRIGAQLRPAR